MKIRYYVIALLILILNGCYSSSQGPTADMVIFSFDRPMQLYALLESINKHMTGLHEIHVIYRTSNQEYNNGYNQVFSTFSNIIKHPQGENPRTDFKPLTLHATLDSPSDHVLFAVDDIIVKEYISISECITHLDKQHAFGFFLRLGKNINKSYMWNKYQKIPPLNEIGPQIYTWKFGQAHWASDWGYPYSLDMTLYRKKDIEPFLRQMNYDNPNRLEGNWSGLAHYVKHQSGLCYTQSKIVNLPLNKVQTVFNNRSMNEYSPHDLLTLFNDNKKIDIAPLATVWHNAAHMEYSPTFISRDTDSRAT